MAKNVMKHTKQKGRAIFYQFMKVLDPQIRRPNQKNEIIHEKKYA